MNKSNAELQTDFLLKQKELFPHLFTRQSVIENHEYLSKFGINIPNKQKLPNVYLKYYPEDFIVEEVLNDGRVASINTEEIQDKTKEEGGDTIYATLVKCGKGTLEVINEIREKLNIERESIQICGLKDRDAITAQRMSIRGSNLDDVKNLQSTNYFLKDISLGKGALSRGAHIANKFTITLRGESPIELNLEKEQPFLNYFYVQRFLSSRPANFYWGLLVLHGKYKEAIESFLFFESDNELPFYKKIRQDIQKNKDNYLEIKKNLEALPVIFEHEITVINHLIKNPEDYRGALKAITKQVEIWLQGMSSWFFNHKISEFIAKNIQLPETFPVFLSQNKDDWLVYKDFAEAFGVFPPILKNIHEFKYIRDISENIKTKQVATVERVTKKDNCTQISFFLPKGAYATTFLSHYVNIVSGKMPESFSKERFTTDKFEKTTEFFKTSNISRDENEFENF